MKITLLPQTAVTFGGKRNPDHNFENFCEFFNKMTVKNNETGYFTRTKSRRGIFE